MQLLEFLDKLKLAHDVPNYYCNKFPKNCGYYDGARYSFDCWNMVKAILSGWYDCKTVGYYVQPKDFVTGDVDGYHLLMACTDRSKDFSKLKQAGTYLYISDRGHEHAGVYVGDFEYQNEIFNVVECTSDWAGKVQYTYVDEKGQRFLYKGGSQGRSWTDYGLLPWVDYDNSSSDPVDGKTLGVDVSRYQKGLTLKTVKNYGYTYSILKSGGADSGYYKDGQFEDFYRQAKKSGMYIGAYYYGNAFSTEDAVREATHFISLLQGKDIVHVYYDVEGKMLNQGYTHLTDIIRTFCQTMINAGYACGIYTSESHFNSRFDDNQLIMFPHWVARYSKIPPTLKSIALVEIWQFGGSVNYICSPKINGYTVDQDQINIPWTDDGSQPKQTVLIEAPEPTKKSADQLAVEVLAGLHGNGIIRRISLGSRYSEVQQRVNEIVEERKQKGKVHIVAKGETLSSIAKRYNTTVDALVKANGIPNKNMIFVNQEIKIV